MPKSLNQSGAPGKLSDVMGKLQEAYRELERLHHAEPGADTVTTSQDELLKTARSLLFIWGSRNSFIDGTLITDPVWLILLNLKISELEHSKTQISRVCDNSGAPATTALRWMKVLESKSILKIEPDSTDARRKLVFLTESGSELMGRYLQNIRNFINTKGIMF